MTRPAGNDCSVVRITKGNPSDVELAALLVALQATVAGTEGPPQPPAPWRKATWRTGEFDNPCSWRRA